MVKAFSKVVGDKYSKCTYAVAVNLTEQIIAVQRLTTYSGAPDAEAKPVSFKTGDKAYALADNLVYLDKIVGITEKNVIFQPSLRGMRKKHMKLLEFAWRNWDFDRAEIDKRNHETSMCI
jgi:hypothetical protein